MPVNNLVNIYIKPPYTSQILESDGRLILKLTFYFTVQLVDFSTFDMYLLYHPEIKDTSW